MKVDFFHSLPISRKKYFFVQYVSGVIIFVVPFIVSMLLCLLVGAVNGLLTGGVVLMAVRMTSFRILEYLAGYGTAILATVMTGKTLTAILGTAVFTVYIPAVLLYRRIDESEREMAGDRRGNPDFLDSAYDGDCPMALLCAEDRGGRSLYGVSKK